MCTHMSWARFGRAALYPLSFCKSLQMKCLSHRSRKIEGLLKPLVKSARQLAVTALSFPSTFQTQGN